MSAHTRVLPLKPLLDLVELLDAPDIASLCGVDRRTVYRWRSGEVTTILPHSADRIAIRMGMHPAEIWGTDWWNLADLVSPADRVRARRAAP